ATCTVDIIENFINTEAILAGQWTITESPKTNITPSGKEEGSKITLTLGGAGWISGDVGSYVSLNGGLCKILAYTSSTVVDALVVKRLGAISTTRVWALEQPEWTEARGYPTAVAFYGQRLFWARGMDIFGSSVGVYDDYATLRTDS